MCVETSSVRRGAHHASPHAPAWGLIFPLGIVLLRGASMSAIQPHYHAERGNEMWHAERGNEMWHAERGNEMWHAESGKDMWYAE